MSISDPQVHSLKKTKTSGKVKSIVAPVIPQLPDETKTPEVVAKEVASVHDLNGKMLHIRVGDPKWDNEMLQQEITKVEEQITSLIEGNNIDCLVLVTPYAVEVNLIESKKGS
jgi:hypothetical protein